MDTQKLLVELNIASNLLDALLENFEYADETAENSEDDLTVNQELTEPPNSLWYAWW